MLTTRLKFAEFVDALLVRLYDLERESQDPGFFSLNQIAAQLTDPVPRGWVFDAAKVLENRGFARCLYTFGGVDAQLSGEGRLYVEEERGATSQVRSHPESFFNVTVSGNNNQVIAGHGSQATQTAPLQQQRAPTFDLIQDIERTLQNDPNLTSQQRLEATTYLNLIRLQVEKPQPDLTLIAAVLEPLGRIPSVASKVANLASLLNG